MALISRAQDAVFLLRRYAQRLLISLAKNRQLSHGRWSLISVREASFRRHERFQDVLSPSVEMQNQT